MSNSGIDFEADFKPKMCPPCSKMKPQIVIKSSQNPCFAKTLICRGILTHARHLQTRKTFKHTARVCKIKGSTLYEKTTFHSPTSTSNLALLVQNMLPNQPQNYFEFPLLILWRFGSYFGLDWDRILPRIWPRTHPVGPQRPSQWPQKVPRGPKGLPWGAP